MKKILITGVHGFVGENLIKAFGVDYELFGLDIVSHKRDRLIKTYNWDQLNEIEVVDTIIHLAGKAHDTKNKFDETKYFEINVGLTKQIFDYFLNSGAKKFIFFSSVKAVADSLRFEILTEDRLPNPHTPYGKSKLAAERYILSKTIPEGKQIYILRPCMIHGPGNKGNLNRLYKFIKLGIPYPLGSFNNSRSFTSIKNLNFILEKIINGNIISGIYQIADNEPFATHEVIMHIADTLGKRARIWKINQQLIKKLAKLGDYLHLPFNSKHLQKLTENYVVSNHKIIEALGTTLPVSSKEGLLQTLKSFSHT